MATTELELIELQRKQAEERQALIDKLQREQADHEVAQRAIEQQRDIAEQQRREKEGQAEHERRFALHRQRYAEAVEKADELRQAVTLFNQALDVMVTAATTLRADLDAVMLQAVASQREWNGIVHGDPEKTHYVDEALANLPPFVEFDFESPGILERNVSITLDRVDPDKQRQAQRLSNALFNGQQLPDLL